MNHATPSDSRRGGPHTVRATDRAGHRGPAVLPAPIRSRGPSGEAAGAVRTTERRLTRLLVPLLVLCLPGAGAARTLSAQEAPEPEPTRAEAHLEVGGGPTLLHGDVTPLLRAAALVSLSPSVAVGGAGAVLPRERDVPGDVVFPDRALGFGYGGVLLEVSLRTPDTGIAVAVRGLLGAGNADLRDRDTGTRLASDNVVVLEPGLVLRRPGSARLRVGLALAWRAVLGLDDVEDVAAGDLSGPSLEIHLRLGPL